MFIVTDFSGPETAKAVTTNQANIIFEMERVGRQAKLAQAVAGL